MKAAAHAAKAIFQDIMHIIMLDRITLLIITIIITIIAPLSLARAEEK